LWIIAGLGNPGARYADTRHNLGFLVADEIARRIRIDLKIDKDAETGQGFMGTEKVMLIKPLTFMNLSGNAVGRILRYYKSGPEHLVVVHDDMDIAPGKLKIRMGGGAGGHNGVDSVISHLGPDFLRVKVGIGKPDRGPKENYVLGRFSSHEQPLVMDAVKKAADAVETIVQEGHLKAMTVFNADTPDS